MSDLKPLPSIAAGRHAHYKGGQYQVYTTVRHSETLEPFVLYRPLSGGSDLWVRPYAMFVESVEVDGQPRPRFERCDDPAVPSAEPPSDEELDHLPPDRLAAEVRRLRQAIRKHRDATGQELCWHHPDLWSLLPEQTLPAVAVPEWPQFMRGCVRYRQSLDDQAPGAPRITQEFESKA